MWWKNRQCNGGGGVLTNSTNHSFELLYLVRFYVCVWSHWVSQNLFWARLFFFFQVLGYLRICSSRRYQNIKKTFFQKFWNVSNVLRNSRPARVPRSKYICSVACGMFQAIDVHGDYNFFRIQPELMWPNLLRGGCFRLWNSICDLMPTGRDTHSLC